MSSPQDPRFTAGLDLVQRTGAKGFQIRYDDEQDPIVWVAVAEYKVRTAPYKAYKVGAALDPLDAVMRLLDEVIDGGTCAHCRRPTGVTDDWRGEMPLDELVCWYRYDPEMKTFRRGCE